MRERERNLPCVAACFTDANQSRSAFDPTLPSPRLPAVVAVPPASASVVADAAVPPAPASVVAAAAAVVVVVVVVAAAAADAVACDAASADVAVDGNASSVVHEAAAAAAAVEGRACHRRRQLGTAAWDPRNRHFPDAVVLLVDACSEKKPQKDERSESCLLSQNQFVSPSFLLARSTRACEARARDCLVTTPVPLLFQFLLHSKNGKRV